MILPVNAHPAVSPATDTLYQSINGPSHFESILWGERETCVREGEISRERLAHSLLTLDRNLSPDLIYSSVEPRTHWPAGPASASIRPLLPALVQSERCCRGVESSFYCPMCRIRWVQGVHHRQRHVMNAPFWADLKPFFNTANYIEVNIVERPFCESRYCGKNLYKIWSCLNLDFHHLEQQKLYVLTIDPALLAVRFQHVEFFRCTPENCRSSPSGTRSHKRVMVKYLV